MAEGQRVRRHDDGIGGAGPRCRETILMMTSADETPSISASAQALSTAGSLSRSIMERIFAIRRSRR